MRISFLLICTTALYKDTDPVCVWGVLRKILTGVCGPGFCNHTLGYGDRGPKSYPWLWKMGQNRTLDIRKWHQINLFWSNLAWNWSNLVQILWFASKKNDGIRSKWPRFAENIPLAMEPQPKLDPWLRKSSQNRPLATEIGLKKDPSGQHHPHPQLGPA